MGATKICPPLPSCRGVLRLRVVEATFPITHAGSNESSKVILIGRIKDMSEGLVSINTYAQG
jgi:hypothetical protein